MRSIVATASRLAGPVPRRARPGAPGRSGALAEPPEARAAAEQVAGTRHRDDAGVGLDEGACPGEVLDDDDVGEQGRDRAGDRGGGLHEVVAGRASAGSEAGSVLALP